MARIGLHLKPQKGYHFLDSPYVEYAGKVEDKDGTVKALQEKFQEIVKEGIQTKIVTLKKDAALELCNRTAENFELSEYGDGADIRIVTVGGFACPCGG